MNRRLIMTITAMALATGAILYVIGELFNSARRAGFKDVGAWGLLIGFLLAYGTELLLELMGA